MTRRAVSVFVAIGSLLLLSGCSDRRVAEIPARPFADYSHVRAEAGHEWRNARRVGGTEPVAIDLGQASAGDVVRIGFFDALVRSRTKGTIRLYAGDRRVQEWRLDRRGTWRDERVTLKGFRNETLRVVVDTTHPVLVAPCEAVTSQSGSRLPNVLVFLIDTLRQDRMSTYGHPRETSPMITKLAAEGTVMTHLTPSSSWTRPSVASLFTSMHPNYHGAQTVRDKLREGLPSLEASLATMGYETQGLMTNANCLPVWGFGTDFARYVDVDALFEAREKNDKSVTDAAIAAIEHLRGRPWYLYVHTMGPHIPYHPPEPFRGRFVTDLAELEGDAREVQRRLDLYDAEIAFTDHQFGRVVEALKATGQYDNTLIVVLSDHGEEFLEHGKWEHAKTLYEEMLRVPLIVKPPKGAWAVPGRVEALVEMVDIASTILEIVGGEIPPRFQGRSFLPLIHGDAEPPRTAYASLNQEWYSLRAAKTREHKYIRDVVQNSDAWYDLATDPQEMKPVAAPEAWGRTLREWVTSRSLGGSSGLHVLLVGTDAPVAAEVTLRATDLGEERVSAAEWTHTLMRDGEVLRWTLSDEKSFLVETLEPGRVPWQAVQRIHAHVSVHVPLDAHVQLDVRVGGVPVDPALVRLGRARTNGSLENAVLELTELLAHPDDFDLASLPKGFGIYVWYVAAAESLTDEAVPADVREALEALGYVN